MDVLWFLCVLCGAVVEVVLMDVFWFLLRSQLSFSHSRPGDAN